MNTAEGDRLACLLFLRCVLPRMAELPLAARAFRGPSVGVTLQAANAVAGTVWLGCGEPVRAPIILRYASLAAAAAAFRGRRVRPLPVRGGWRLLSLWRFGRLTAQLERVLRPGPADLEDADLLHAHLTALLPMALEGLSLLADDGEPWVRARLASGPEGLAAFSVRGEPGLDAWIELEAGGALCGRGQPSESPDVLIEFADARLASAALRGQLDEQAAIGRGELSLRGLVPLADHLNALLQRVEFYLEGEYAQS